MSNKEIEVTIETDGSITIEAFGFKGKGCHEELEKLRKKLGNVKRITKKDEYHLRDRVKNKEKLKERQRE